jgi:hypothetical protein
MSWIYELRGAENRLVEIRSGFATEKAARSAAQRAKRLVDCICYPNLETLTVVVKESDSAAIHMAEMPDAAGESSSPAFETALRYPWQQLVLDAFREPHPENVALRINVAERAISQRLLDDQPFELAERLAIGEALLSLRRLLTLMREGFTDEESSSEESFA